MDEAALSEQIIDLMDVTLMGLSLFFTVVAAYITALYYFLHRAPFLLKLGSYLFFTITVVFLMIFTRGAQDHAAGVILALQQLDAMGELGPVGQLALARGGTLDLRIQGMMWAGLGMIYLALTYLTFLHRWRGTPS